MSYVEVMDDIDDIAIILHTMDAALAGDPTCERAASLAAERIYDRHPEAEARLDSKFTLPETT